MGDAQGDHSRSWELPLLQPGSQPKPVGTRRVWVTPGTSLSASACPPGQSVLSPPCQVVCVPRAAVSNPLSWNSAALSAPMPVAGHGQELLHEPTLPEDKVLPPPQWGRGTRSLPAPAPRSARGTTRVLGSRDAVRQLLPRPFLLLAAAWCSWQR